MGGKLGGTFPRQVLRVGSASALSKIPLLLWLKALDALYNFPAAGKVVGGKPGAR